MNELDGLFQLCLNHIHGEENFLYKELSRKRIRELALFIVEWQYEASMKTINKFKMLSTEEQTETMDSLRKQLKVMET